MSKMKKWYDGLTKEGQRNADFKYKHEGYSAFMAIFTEHIKETLCVILLFIVLIGSAIGIATCSFNMNAEYCRHENVDLKQIALKDHKIVVYCNECWKTIPLNSKTTSKTLHQPNCKTEGIMEVTYTCTRFPEYSFTETIKTPLGSCINTVLEERIEPTCYSTGRSTLYQCSVCNRQVGGEILDKIDHIYEDYGYVAPTCIEKGITPIEKCKDCGITRGEHHEIDYAPHNITSTYTIDKDYQNGDILMGTCEVCNDDFIQKISSDPLVKEVFEYTFNEEDKTATLTTLLSSSSNIVVPGYINGYQVKEISESLFENNDTIETISFNEGVETIGKKAFKNAKKLKTIKFPNSLKEIEEEAFAYCNEIRRLNIHEGHISKHAFLGCKNLRIVELENTLDGISNDSFYNCHNLIFFRFPNYISNDAPKIFNSQHKSGEHVDYFVPLTSGAYSLIFTYSNKEKADDIIKEIDGFYYYKNYSTNTLLSIDRNEKHIVFPDNIKSIITEIKGSTFNYITDEIESIVIPSTITRITRTDRCLANIKFYFEGSDSLGNSHDINGSITDIETQETTYYQVVRYFYIDENEYGQSSPNKRYWTYDENGNIKELRYPYVNWSNLTYHALGGNITYGLDGETNTIMENPYTEIVSNALGLKGYSIQGEKDATLFATDPNSPYIYGQINHYAFIQIVSVMAGLEDFIQNVPLGTINDDSFDTLYGALNITCEELYRTYDSEFLFFMTPLKQWALPETNAQGYTLEDVCTAIKEVCNKQFNKIPVLDMYNLCDYSKETDPNSNGLYPTQKFIEEQFAPIIIDYIDKNYK